jgi:hypothetical protein
VKKPSSIPKGLTAVDEEEMDHSNRDDRDDDEESDESDEEEAQEDAPPKPAPQPKWKPRPPKMIIKTSMARDVGAPRKKSFEARLSKMRGRRSNLPSDSTTNITATERSITFVPRKKHNGAAPCQGSNQGRVDKKGRRRASGNAFRGM